MLLTSVWNNEERSDIEWMEEHSLLVKFGVLNFLIKVSTAGNEKQLKTHCFERCGQVFTKCFHSQLSLRLEFLKADWLKFPPVILVTILQNNVKLPFETNV